MPSAGPPRYVLGTHVQNLEVDLQGGSTMRSDAPGKFARMNGSRSNRLLLLLLPACLLLLAHPSFGQGGSASQPVTSQWVYYDAQHRLQYKLLPSGDRIMDFSTAGYEQGELPIPNVPIMATVGPSGSDDTDRIQRAIDDVSVICHGSLKSGVPCGAVLLLPGTYSVRRSLTIRYSGVVVRGSGESNTVITMIPAVLPSKPYPLFVFGTQDINHDNEPSLGRVHLITDKYVRSGFNTLHVDVGGVAELKVGDAVIITRPVTQKWVDGLMKMDDTYCESDSGTPNEGCVNYCWIDYGDDRLQTDRRITAITGNKITLDAPMSDSIDSKYCGRNGAILQKYTFDDPTTGVRISQVGVEDLRVVAPRPPDNLVPPTETYQLAVSYAVENAWIRNLTALDTLQSVVIDGYSKQVTVKNIAIDHTITQTDNAMFMEFYIAGATQVLMEDLTDTANHTILFATSLETQGPNVLRNSNFYGGDSRIEPHHRWATGLLIENTVIAHDPAAASTNENTVIAHDPAAGSTNANTINLVDRGAFGTFHGWAIGWGVVWNCSADQFTIQRPPGSQNWCIGCTGVQKKAGAPLPLPCPLPSPPPPLAFGPNLPQGAIDAPNKTVTPLSLYEAQLADRLGGSLSCQQ
jgi:hypothetical protein